MSTWLHGSSPKMHKKKKYFRLVSSSPLIHNSMTGCQFIQCQQ